MKKNNGITLIALIITIVVLIILAGVAINLSLGDNGIFKKAKQAKEDTLVAQNEEAVELAKADEFISGSRETVTIDKAEYDKLKSLISVEGNVFKDRPDTWASGTEYSWDDGENILYGQRFTGTITAGANVTATNINTPFMPASGKVASIINYGGDFNIGDKGRRMAVPGRGDSSFEFDVYAKSAEDGGIVYNTKTTTARTNSPFDIWVLYTKLQ